MASIIKAVLCLENRTIFPNIKFDSPYPRLISAAIEVYSRTFVNGVILDTVRTLRAELEMCFATLGLDKLDRDAASAVLHVLRKLQDTVRKEDTQRMTAGSATSRQTVNAPSVTTSSYHHDYTHSL